MLVVNTPIKGQGQTRDVLITLTNIILEVLACAVRSKKENSKISKLFFYPHSRTCPLILEREGRGRRGGVRETFI